MSKIASASWNGAKNDQRVEQSPLRCAWHRERVWLSIWQNDRKMRTIRLTNVGNVVESGRWIRTHRELKTHGLQGNRRVIALDGFTKVKMPDQGTATGPRQCTENRVNTPNLTVTQRCTKKQRAQEGTRSPESGSPFPAGQKMPIHTLFSRRGPFCPRMTKREKEQKREKAHFIRLWHSQDEEVKVPPILHSLNTTHNAVLPNIWSFFAMNGARRPCTRPFLNSCGISCGSMWIVSFPESKPVIFLHGAILARAPFSLECVWSTVVRSDKVC